MKDMHRLENSLVKIQNISKRYKDTQALDDVSMEIAEGEIFGYIGPNGAGKTTTIKILVGLISKFEGGLTVGGLKMPEEKTNIHKLLGYMPQDVAFQEWRTVDHAMASFGLLSGMTRPSLETRIPEVLDFVGLIRERQKKITHLSGGMVQKLGLAQALLHKPKLLVLDEPLTGLDPESRYYLKKIIQDLSTQGITCFFSSHILSDVQDIADRIGIIDHGKILKLGTLQELKSHFSVVPDIRIVMSREFADWDKLKPVPFVKEITTEGPLGILIHLADGADLDAAVHNIIQELIRSDCRIRSIYPVEPSLDDVYLKYIREGRSS